MFKAKCKAQETCLSLNTRHCSYERCGKILDITLHTGLLPLYTDISVYIGIYRFTLADVSGGAYECTKLSHKKWTKRPSVGLEQERRVLQEGSERQDKNISIYTRQTIYGIFIPSWIHET
jgi:hypothetical protein